MPQGDTLYDNDSDGSTAPDNGRQTIKDGGQQPQALPPELMACQSGDKNPISSPPPVLGKFGRNLHKMVDIFSSLEVPA